MKFFIISTSILIAYIVSDLLFDEILWDQSIEFTKYLQSHTFKGEDLIFRFFSFLIVIPIAIGGFQLLFSSKKIESLLYIFMCMIGFITNGLLKNAYHQPRPYWVSSEIEGLGCNMEYGKPSGHAQTSVIIYFSFLFIFFPLQSGLQNQKIKVQEEQQDQQDQQSKQYNSKNLTIFLIVLATICTIMTGLSRVYLGVHSIGQVILGWIIGLYIVLNYQIYIHEFLFQYFKSQFENNNEDDLKFQRLSVSTSGLYILIIIIDIILLELNKHVFNQDQQEIDKWLQNINECKEKELNYYQITNTKVIYNPCFIHGSLFSLIFGIIQGCFISQGSFLQQQYTNSIKQLEIAQKIYRCLLYLPMLLPLPLLLIQTNKIYITTFLIFTPVICYECFYMTILYPKLLKKFNLQIKGDFLESKKGQYEQLYQSL